MARRDERELDDLWSSYDHAVMVGSASDRAALRKRIEDLAFQAVRGTHRRAIDDDS